MLVQCSLSEHLLTPDMTGRAPQISNNSRVQYALRCSAVVIHVIDALIFSSWRNADVRRCRRCHFMASGKLCCRGSAGELFAHPTSPDASAGSPQVVALLAGWDGCRLRRGGFSGGTYGLALRFLNDDAGRLIHMVSRLISCKSPCSVRLVPSRRCNRV